MKSFLALAAVVALTTSAEGQRNPAQPLALTAVREFKSYRTTYPALIELDAAAAPGVVLAVWIKDLTEIYAQRFSRLDLAPLDQPRLLHSSPDLNGGVRVIHDGEKFVVLWPLGSCCEPPNLVRQVIREDGTTEAAVIVASKVGQLDDVLWEGREVIVAGSHSVTVLDAEGDLVAQYPSIDLDSEFAVSAHGVHAVWQTDSDPRECRINECAVSLNSVESTSIAKGSSISPTTVTNWSVAPNELFHPDIAAMAREVVIAVQRYRTPYDPDDIVAFRMTSARDSINRGDVFLGSGHAPAVGAFGRRFAFAWRKRQPNGTLTMELRASDGALSHLTAPLSIVLDENFGHYFTDVSRYRPRIVALSDSQFLVVYLSGWAESSLALISAGPPARPRVVRPTFASAD
jgi:hypothetical protein